MMRHSQPVPHFSPNPSLPARFGPPQHSSLPRQQPAERVQSHSCYREDGHTTRKAIWPVIHDWR